MIITCEECKTSYNLSANLLQPSGSKVRCTNCQHVFTAFPSPEEVPVMVKAEPVAETQMDTPTPQPSDEPAELGADDLFGLDEEDSFGEDMEMGVGDGDEFDLAGEDFDLPGNDIEPLQGGEPTEADLRLTDEDLDLVMNMAPPEANTAVETAAPSTDRDAALAGGPEGLQDLQESIPAESDGGPQSPSVSEAELDLDLDLDFGEEAETAASETPAAPSAPELEGADELDLDLDLDLDLGEEETAADSGETTGESTLSLDEAFGEAFEEASDEAPKEGAPEGSAEDFAEGLSADLDMDEELDLTDSLDLGDESDGGEAAGTIPDSQDAGGLDADDDLGFEDLDLELDLDEEDGGAGTDSAASVGGEPELALELEDDGNDTADSGSEVAGANKADDDDLDLDLDFDLDEADPEAPTLEGNQDEGDALLELDLEEDTDASPGEDDDDGLSLELDNLDLMADESSAGGDKADDELSFDLDGDLELSLDDDANAAGTSGADTPEEDDLDLADLEGILEEDGTAKEQAASGAVAPKEESLLGDDDLGLNDELESILDDDDDDSADTFSLDEEPELDLDLENPELASSADDDLDLSDFEYLAEDGEKAPSDTHFDSGDMELEFEVDEESASALEEADAQVTPPSPPEEKRTAPERTEPEIVPEPAAAVKAPAGPAPLPKKRGTSKLLIAVLIIVLLLGGGYCAYVLMDGMGIRIPYLSDYLKPEANDPGNLQMTTFDINSRFVDSQTLGRIFVITGKVKNGYDHPRGFVQLTGKLFTQGKKLSSSQTVYAGNLISDMDLVNLNADELKKRLNNRFGNNRINSRVQPGKALPFMVVFTDLPKEQLEEFTIEVDASTALK